MREKLLVSKKDIENIMALTPIQEGIFFHYLKEPLGEQYVEQLSLFISGDIDVSLVEDAWNFVVASNEMLRAVFRWQELKRPLQVILEHHRLDFRFYDFSRCSAVEMNEKVQNVQEDDRAEKFDLRRVPFRVTLCRLTHHRYVMLISNNHILFDGWSSGIILKEFFNAYHDLKKGKTPIKPVKNKFHFYIKWFYRQGKEERAAFWRAYFSDFESAAEMAIKGKRTASKREVKRYKIEIPAYITTSLNNFTQEYRITLASFFYTVWGILLQKYNRSQDVVFGTTLSGRNAGIKGIENIVGIFINTLPLRVTSHERQTILELLMAVNKSALSRHKYSRTPLVEIREYAGVSNQSGLFDHIVIVENYPLDVRLSVEEDSLFSIDSYSIYGFTNYDFAVSIYIQEPFEVDFAYDRDLFSEEIVAAISLHFISVVEHMLDKPDDDIQEIHFLSDEERRKVLFEFNDTAAHYPGEQTVVGLFEKQVEENPERIALAFADHRLTYREFGRSADRLAELLSEKGTGTGSIVGMMVEYTLETVIGMFAILKAGGAYLPIEPNLPVARLGYILKDSAIDLLLIQQPLAKTAAFPGECVDINERNLYPAVSNTTCLHPLSRPRDIVYTIYTSGTTGKPKGVQISNENLANYIHWLSRAADIGARDKTVLTSSLSFDLGYTLVYSSLLNGGELHIIPREIYLSSDRLMEHIRLHRISYIKVTPSFFSVILDDAKFSMTHCSNLRLVILGGEQINPKDVERAHHACPHLRTMNHYGPTEATIGSVATFIDFDQLSEYKRYPSIGKPIANSRAYVLDKNLRLQPIGIAGELCISGRGLARGYLGNPELTAEKFVPNPLKRKERLYRTGDLARWLPDGNIEFLGRIDQQVKIRGFRIELAEIESHLVRHPGVKEAVVMARTGKSVSLYLCAYIVRKAIRQDEGPSPPDLRRFLSRILPDYMIPSHFVFLERLPLTPNGKVDRNAMPEPEAGVPGEEYIPPGNEDERQLTGVWQEVLGIEKVGVADNFFEIGGDSIKAIQVSTRLLKYGMKLEVNDLFLHPTIRELTVHVKTTDREVEQGLVEGQVELTPIQRWFFETQYLDAHHFNQAVMLYRPEGFDEEILKRVFSKIVEHHDALRIVFKRIDDGIMQWNRGMQEPLFDFTRLDVKQGNNIPAKIEEEANRQQRTINLETGPLLKLCLCKTSKGDHLLIVIHHLVVDGVSWRILFKDLAHGYRRAERGETVSLPPKTDSYRSYSQKLTEYARSQELLNELPYWEKIENSEIEKLPIDGKSGGEHSERKNTVTMTINLDVEHTNMLLREVNRAYNTNINDILLTALARAIKSWVGLEKLFITLEGHGREAIIEGISILRTFGWFTSRFPVILDIGSSNEIAMQLKIVKETLRRVPNRGVGYEILKYLTPQEKRAELGFDAEPEILFNFLGQFEQERQEELFTVSQQGIGETRSPRSIMNHKLQFNGWIYKDSLELEVRYNRREYRSAAIEKLLALLRTNLIEIIDHCRHKEEKESTPSDFGAVEISLEDLEDIKEVLDLSSS